MVASVFAVTNNFERYSGEKRDIKMSSISSTPYQAIWYNRIGGESEDPWLSLTDHGPAAGEGNIIYGEANYNRNSVMTKILPLHNGANVYIRKKRKCCKNKLYLVVSYNTINIKLIAKLYFYGYYRRIYTNSDRGRMLYWRKYISPILCMCRKSPFMVPRFL